MPTAVASLATRLAEAAGHLFERAERAPPPAAPPLPEHTKASAAGPLIAFEHLRRPVWTPRDYAVFADEGFRQNAIVYRCVRMIAECAAHVPLLLYSGDREIEDHALLDLLHRPNGHEAWPDFMQRLVGFLLVSGNAYVEAVAIDGRLREIFTLRPDRIKVVPGPDGWPEAFDYTAAGRTVRIGGDAVDGVRAMLHVKLFHPTSDHYGLSPLEAAASAIDLHNTASRWNKALLDNSARPSGAIVYTARDGNLTGEQIERLKSELEAGFQGSANAGRPLLLEGGLDWKAMSLSPKDMDFIEARHVAAREIALALGVPPMLLGIPGDNTYANLAEAQRSFWRQTVLPLVERIASQLSLWLSPGYPPGDLTLRPDLDSLPALAAEREALWSSLEKTTFLTTDEKRALAGFTPAPDADAGPGAGGHLKGQQGAWPSGALTDGKFNPSQPRAPSGNPNGGQWTNGDGGDGNLLHPIAKRPRGEGRFPRDHNNPPKPLPVLPPASGTREPAALRDEAGALAPRGFSSLDELNAFKAQLASELPDDVSAVMQGSAVERGGVRFRDAAQGDLSASDFDVSLTGGDLFDRAALRLPRMVKGDRVGPLDEERLLEAGIDLRGASARYGRDVKFMIYRSQIDLYLRGPGYPLVTR